VVSALSHPKAIYCTSAFLSLPAGKPTLLEKASLNVLHAGGRDTFVSNHEPR
jgi:hypothetical protein